MLYNNVICIYYPFAGLADTMAGPVYDDFSKKMDNDTRLSYGLPVTYETAVKNIVDMVTTTENIKNCVRVRGKRYAASCSWNNRADRWIDVIMDVHSKPCGVDNPIMFVKEHDRKLIQTRIRKLLRITTCFDETEQSVFITKVEDMKKTNPNMIAMFNGFKFNYEMYGPFLQYCKQHCYPLVIYTTDESDMCWFEFYKVNFPGVVFRKTSFFEKERLSYKLIIVTTDDDNNFKEEWIQDNVMCLDHFISNRRKTITNHLSIRKGFECKQWFVPFFSLNKLADKAQLVTNKDTIEIVIVEYMSTRPFQFDLLKRLQFKHIHFSFISMMSDVDSDSIQRMFLDRRDISVSIHNNIDTFTMFSLLFKADYLFVNATNNSEEVINSLSRGIPMAFATLCKLIISKKNNSIHQFINVVEYDDETNDSIILTKPSIEDISNLETERTQIENSLIDYLDKLLS
jgi:hypothetical protein